MAIRNIKINDKRSDEELIGRLNDRISGKTNTPRWDNHGPIQFEEQDNDHIEEASESKAHPNKMDTRMRTQKNEQTIEDFDWSMDPSNKAKEYEEVNHPQHYNNYDVEVIDMMERVFGKSQTATFCKLNAFKYRMRAGTKPGQDVVKDLDKEKWYLNKYKELKAKCESVNDLVGKLQQNGQL